MDGPDFAGTTTLDEFERRLALLTCDAHHHNDLPLQGMIDRLHGEIYRLAELLHPHGGSISTADQVARARAAKAAMPPAIRKNLAGRFRVNLRSLAVDIERAFRKHIGQPTDGGTCAVDDGEVFGMDLVESSIMPEGWIGIRTEKGVTCIGPKGSFFVPAFDVNEFINRPLGLK